MYYYDSSAFHHGNWWWIAWPLVFVFIFSFKRKPARPPHGSKLTQCPACGAVHPPVARFCPHCGKAL